MNNKKEYSKQQILKMLKSKLSDEEFIRLQTKLEDTKYSLIETSNLDVLKEKFTNIKDIYYDDNEEIRLEIKSEEVINNNYTRAGFINRYETNYSNSSKFNFSKFDCVVQSDRNKYILINKIYNKINEIVSDVCELIFYVPEKYY